MKVSISNFNKPAPFLSGLFNAAGSIGAAGISAAAAKDTQDRQMKYDKEMAGINQRNILEQMDYANDLQIEQWQRENEYNDPSAVRARYEKAGISPQAAFGQGSASGAGIAGGLSGAPSGSSTGHSSTLAAPNLSALNSLGSIGTDVVNAMLTASEKRKTDAETFGIELENKYKEIKTQTEIQDAIATLELKLEDKKLKQSERKKMIAEIDWLRKQSEKVDSDIKVNDQNIKESQKRADYHGKMADKVAKETEIMQEQRTAMLEGLVANTYLKGAQEEYYLELTNKVGKDIELIGKDLENYDINLSARLAQMTSSELRGWAGVLNEYLERRDRTANEKHSNDEKNRQNRILLLRLVLPYLLK